MPGDFFKKSLRLDGEVPSSFEVRHRSLLWGLDPNQEGQVTVDSERFLSVVRYLNRFIDHHGQGWEWTTVRVLHVEGSGIRSEVQVAACSMWMIALGGFQGGGLWMEDLSGKGPLIREFPDGRIRSGHVREFCNSPLRLRVIQGQAYAMEAWTGGEVWILQAFVALKGWSGDETA